MKWTNHITVENRLLQRHDQVHVHVPLSCTHSAGMLVDLPPSHSHSPSLTPYSLSLIHIIFFSLPSSLPSPSLLPSLLPSLPPSLPPPPPALPPSLPPSLLPQGRGWFGADGLLHTLPNPLLDTHIRPALLAYGPTQNITLAPVRTSLIVNYSMHDIVHVRTCTCCC